MLLSSLHHAARTISQSNSSICMSSVPRLYLIVISIPWSMFYAYIYIVDWDAPELSVLRCQYNIAIE